MVEVETAAEMADAVLTRAAATSSSWPLRSRTTARETWRRPSSTRQTACPRSASSRHSTSSPSSAPAPASRPGAGRLRRRDGPLAERAAAKLEAKGVDLIVANDVAAAGAGFGSRDERGDDLSAAVAPARRSRSSRRRAVAEAVLRAALPLLSVPTQCLGDSAPEAPEVDSPMSVASAPHGGPGRDRE